MALKSRAHEILMAEMAVLVKRYRRERGRLCEVNRTLIQRLAELEAQVRKLVRGWLEEGRAACRETRSIHRGVLLCVIWYTT